MIGSVPRLQYIVNADEKKHKLLFNRVDHGNLQNSGHQAAEGGGPYRRISNNPKRRGRCLRRPVSLVSAIVKVAIYDSYIQKQESYHLISAVLLAAAKHNTYYFRILNLKIKSGRGTKR